LHTASGGGNASAAVCITFHGTARHGTAPHSTAQHSTVQPLPVVEHLAASLARTITASNLLLLAGLPALEYTLVYLGGSLGCLGDPLE